ncbi:hypothetical protein AQUCO_08300010v1 [Aquilegia coerulea]|uniref:Cytochrome P450 n=1 Tax=Aquilegia coerulea TaxID=218851 RepID=A0A2G5C6V8_AQUCA|nr:hypothetical protein AQUCO_08300010v1 [Aquilegia coerulea]
METMYLIVSVLLLILVICNKLLQRKYHHKNLPPSPPSLPIIGHFHLLKQPVHTAIDKLIQLYGPVLFLWFGFRPVVVLSSPAAIKECFTKNDIIFANRPRLLMGGLTEKYSVIPLAQYGHLWRNLRRVTAIELFSLIRLDMSSNGRKGEARSLIRKMFKNSNGEFMKVELKSVFYKLVFNFLARILGMKPYFGEEEMVDPQMAKDKLDALRSKFSATPAFGLGDFFPFLKWISRWRMGKKTLEWFKKRDQYLQNILDGFRSRASISSKEEKEKKRTIVDVLLSLQETEPELYTDDVIKGIILVTFVGGSGTSTTTMEWAMSLLLNHPEVLDKARNEIEHNVGCHQLLDESDLVKLPYLRCIISETLRVCPIGAFLAPHESSEDCTIGGYNVPKGTMLLVNQQALYKDPKVWPEPTMFKPERFEKSKRENEGTKWIGFGQGRRGCPGEALANRTLGLTLGLLIQCFDWERVGGEMVDMTTGDQRLMTKAKPLEAMYRPRKALLNVLSQL